MADSSRTLTAAFATDEDMCGVDGADGEEEEEPCVGNPNLELQGGGLLIRRTVQRRKSNIPTKMKILVKTLKGSHFEIKVNPEDTVTNVKKNIETVQGSDVYPAEQHMLIHQGKLLKDETTLAEILIREINPNISEVVGLYSDLSESFSGIVQQR